MNELERAAHQYVEASNWSVFPAAPGEKTPMTAHGYLDASTDHRKIQRWWKAHPDANVAIATGGFGPDVLDVDVHPDGTGYPAWNKLKAAGLVPEPKAIVRTPSGGMHAYFQGTGQTNGHLSDQHLDFRALGGYVVAPPSQVGGRLYTVAKHRPSAATFDWTAAREHLSPQPERRPYQAPEHDADHPRRVAHLAVWMAAQHEGNRNEALFWAANRAVEAGDTETLAALEQAARESGLEERAIKATIGSALKTSRPHLEREAEAGLIRRDPLTPMKGPDMSIATRTAWAWAPTRADLDAATAATADPIERGAPRAEVEQLARMEETTDQGYLARPGADAKLQAEAQRELEAG